MDFGIRGKFALVTGGSHGIGRSIAFSLADEGCNVAICARNEQRLRETENALKDKGVKTIAICADTTNLSNIEYVMERINELWGKLHILVNNVGGGGSWGNTDIEQNSDDVWTAVYEKNALSMIRFTKLALPFMRKEKWGRVVTISSIFGYEAGGRHPWYNMAKAAQISYIKNLSIDPNLSGNGITFNTVAPGFMQIPDTGLDRLQRENIEEFRKLLEDCPLGRFGLPEEVASVVAFLCSDNARLVNGSLIAVDGGQSKAY